MNSSLKSNNLSNDSLNSLYSIDSQSHSIDNLTELNKSPEVLNKKNYDDNKKLFVKSNNNLVKRNRDVKIISNSPTIDDAINIINKSKIISESILTTNFDNNTRK